MLRYMYIACLALYLIPKTILLCLSGWGMGRLMQMCITGKNIHTLTYPSSVCWHVCYRSAVSSRNSTFRLRNASFLFLECQKLESRHRLLALNMCTLSVTLRLCLHTSKSAAAFISLFTNPTFRHHIA